MNLTGYNYCDYDDWFMYFSDVYRFFYVMLLSMYFDMVLYCDCIHGLILRYNSCILSCVNSPLFFRYLRIIYVLFTYYIMKKSMRKTMK